jgi:acetyltransferase-like isoleucine patch superfamily enzyme
LKKLWNSVWYRLARLALIIRHRNLVLGNRVKLGKRLRLFLSKRSSVSLGHRVTLQDNVNIEAHAGVILIGQSTFIGTGSFISAMNKISIGSDCLIAEYVSIRDHDHKFEIGKITNSLGFESAPILIGNNVWIAAKATITKGVTIGDNCVIGAGAVVTRDVPEGCIALGVPARWQKIGSKAVVA